MDHGLTSKLRADALAIWQSGVDAANAEQVTRSAIGATELDWTFGSIAVARSSFDRIAVLGGGKAVDGMVRGVCGAMEHADVDLLGWVNVPDELAGQVGHIRLHAGRPWGVNEPTAAAVAGTREMLQLVAGLSARDLCLCLLTGGGSALISAPPAGVRLDDKIRLVRQLVAAGANIQEINCVRRCLSDVKGGGLARACRAGQMVTMLISDVLDDDLAAIASGPTVVGSRDPVAAERIIRKYVPQVNEFVVSILPALAAVKLALPDTTPPVPHVILANLRAAMSAAADTAARLGYRVTLQQVAQAQPDANEVGRAMGQELVQLSAGQGKACTISGGEPTLELVDAPRRGKGGRNQQLVLAAMATLLQHQEFQRDSLPRAMHHGVLLSAGTDGEDGPTDAAGAILDAEVVASALDQQLDPQPYLATNDAYAFFQQTNGLIKTGWTGTNVCDLRVLLRGDG